MLKATLFASLCAAAVLTGCASTRTVDSGPPAYGTMGQAQIFDGMGPYTRKVTTDSAEAQRYFNQGLNWLYAFNHDEAVLAFTRAAELDPGCAMAWWGIAQAQGPNYNDWMMSESRSAAAWEALQNAVAAIDNENAVEIALIEALQNRYAAAHDPDRWDLDSGFADAMDEVYARYPDDPDVGSLYAESLMVLHPWMLYRSDGEPAREDTLVLVEVLERVQANEPYHPGANHLYIHAIEPSNDKARAIPAAQRLNDLVPSSGHMMHMPSHIYVQVGMWDEAIEQNNKAMAADAEYRRRAPDQIIQHMYMTHNAHMRAYASMMAGREEEAMASARSMWDNFPEELLPVVAAFVDPTMCSVYDVQKRFGRWEALLAEPAPPAYLPITTAMWRAHRAIAYAALKDFDSAIAEQAAFREAMRAIPAEPGFASYGDVMKILLVSEYFVSAEIALQQGELEIAAGLLEQAADIEDTIGYGEPPIWLQPVRHTLGAVYLKAGEPEQAARVYREDLAQWPRNGWSLLGLSQALEAGGDMQAAQVARREFEKVWANADEPATTSCKCIAEVAGQ
jgi:tetratricopeptide (TPR) repeat protein